MHNVIILAQAKKGHKSARYLHLFSQNHDIYALDTKYMLKKFTRFFRYFFPTMSVAIKCLKFGKGYNSVSDIFTKVNPQKSGIPDCMPDIMVLARAVTCSSGSQEITLLYKKLQ